MLRNLFISLLLVFSIHKSNAQFVTLTNAGFISCLNSQGFGSCLSGPGGNLLDTTCIPVVMASYLFCNNFNIHDLNGIQYFDHLIGLSCSSNPLVSLPTLPLTLKSLTVTCPQLSSLPDLPPTLEYLRCSGLLTSIPPLPATLKELDCSYNQLSTLPILPAGLEKLNIGLNQFTIAPLLPNGLKEFNCYSNQLTALPVLPDSLLILDCSTNFLSTLPALPVGLNTLNCSYNQLSTLPSLPAALQILECDHNQLTTIPTFPSNLNLLECSSNLIASLPQLPAALTTLYCINNQLTSLPLLPPSLQFLSIAENTGIKCLPYIKELQTFYWSLTGITCLPNQINVSGSCNPPLANYPVCDMWNENNCSYYWNISGRTFRDHDADCENNIQEEQYKNIKVLLYTNGNLVQQTYTNNYGQYSFDADSGIYIYAPDTSAGYTVACPSSGTRTSILTSADSLDYNMDFALECVLGYDVGVSSVVRTSGLFRPGHTATVKVLAGDLSNRYGLHCASGISGSVQVAINGPATYQNILPGTLTPVVSGNTLTYSIADFGTVNFNSDFGFAVLTDTNITIGQEVCFDVTVTPFAGDNDTTNNYFSNCSNIINSFDPNNKEVNPSGVTDTSVHWLTYTINFQNTGNAPAQHIYIIDTLDNDIDESSFELLSYSYEPMVQIIGNRVRFNFANINLPDSVSNEAGSHGYVQYKVKRKNNIAIGSVIENTAFIYFDFNSPVQTNTTSNQLSAVTGISSIKKENVVFSIFPNPLNNESILNIYFNSSSTKSSVFKVYDLSGRVVYSSNITSSEKTQKIKLPSLAKGIYQCDIDYVSGHEHQKLVIAE